MAAALEDRPQVPPEQDSGSPSMAPLDDIEKTQLSEPKETAEGNKPNFQRPVKGYRWVLVCVGLYLGAVLYGE